jgi:hypothetical protein
MAEGRFELEWTHPFNPGAATHVSLFEGGRGPLYIVASGHGADDVEALVDLLKTLRERNESAAAIAYVSEEYRTLTGQSHSRPRS